MAALQRLELVVLALPERQLPVGLVQTQIPQSPADGCGALRRSSPEGGYFPPGTLSLTSS